MLSACTNTDLAHIAEEIKERDNFILCGHVSPDGDCLGSQLALFNALVSMGKHAVCVLAEENPVVDDFMFMPGMDKMIKASDYEGLCENFICVDVPHAKRMGEAASVLHARSKFTITIDHHDSDKPASSLNYVDPDAPSCSMLIWDLVALLGIERSYDVALCAYTGLVTDTGRFQHQNTTAQAFSYAADMVACGLNPGKIAALIYQRRSLASLTIEGIALDRMQLMADGRVVLSWLSVDDFVRSGATKADAEPLIDVLRSLSSVSVACMLREQGDCIRGSFRAKDDTDVAALANGLGGGGHKAAAGFTLECSLEEAVERVKTVLAEVYPA